MKLVCGPGGKGRSRDAGFKREGPWQVETAAAMDIELNMRMDELDASLNKRMDKLDASLNKRMDERDSALEARFTALEASLKETIQRSVANAMVAQRAGIEEVVTNAIAAQRAREEEAVARAQAARQARIREQEDEIQITAGLCALVWAFRRFWIPVVPKSWVNTKAC